MKKKHADISSFYKSVTKIMIISYTVPEIWRVTVAQKFKIKKNKKNAWRYPHFTHVYQKV